MGDCYWRDKPVGPKVISDLARKTSTILPEHDGWSVYYTIFSAFGWTAKAKAEAEELVQKAANRARKNWRTVGIRLVDLETLSDDLNRWSKT